MGKITDLKFQKNKKRVNVFLDGQYYCGLQYETIIKNHITAGQFVEKQTIDSIQLESEKERAKEIALTLLEKKLYSQNGLSKKLKEKGFLPETIRFCIEQLSGYGYVNDTSYVKCYCNDNHRRSKKDLEYKLRAKGIDVAEIKEYLENIPIEKEYDNCEYWAQKFYKSNKNKPNIQQKLVAHLASKGFGFDIIKSIVGKIVGDVDYE